VKFLRAALISLLISLLVGLAIGTWIRLRLEAPVRYIGQSAEPVGSGAVGSGAVGSGAVGSGTVGSGTVGSGAEAADFGRANSSLNLAEARSKGVSACDAC